MEIFQNLNEAFKAAKQNRDILSKEIIWESGVSKSQFYRIISGKETPSPETKIRVSKSFNIEIEEFDRLHAQAKLDTDTESTVNLNGTWGDQKGLRYSIFALAAVLAVGIISILILDLNQPDAPKMDKVVSSPKDSTSFIRDVTIPDGTSIPVDTTFVKTWRVKNTGQLVWKDRYLKRTTPKSDLVCSSPAMVPIPETAPGETVDISVTFTTPHLPGSCRTDWKSSDKNGNLHFPDMHGLFSVVTVTR